MLEAQPRTCTVFAGSRRIAAGSLREILPTLKERFDRDPGDGALVFDDETGAALDFDLSGSLDEVLTRADPTPHRGPGRPRLGVASREVSLLPQHWDWLEGQSMGCSGALRRLVARAMDDQPGEQRARRVRAALSRFLTSMAGDRPGYEEATRALFAGDLARFESHVRRWPRDVREYALDRARAAAQAEGAPTPGAVVQQLYQRVWSDGDHGAIERLVAPAYVIHSDPGDQWEGQTLDRATYRQRLDYSRRAFTDLTFSVLDLVTAGSRVAVRWSAAGEHTGDLVGAPATGRRLTFSGHTTYEVRDGRVTGHWQLVDRLGFVEQLRIR